MTHPTNWPNPERPGVPMFPDRDGWHVLRVFGSASIEWWSAAAQAFDNYYDPQYVIYDCACLTPTQIAELLAGERERCAKECERIPSVISRTLAHAIRNLGAAQ